MDGAVIVADAKSVRMEGKFDGLLAFAAADIYASPEALANLLPYLKDDARVVAFGAQLSRRHSGLVLIYFFACSGNSRSLPLPI